MPADAPLARLRRATLTVAAAACCVLGAAASAATAPADPALAPTVAVNPALEADTMELAHKLRCLVCQNQSIAESNAPLALDLRDQVREQLAAGKSKDEVIDYLVERYGDFVLYRPRMTAQNFLLWAAPALLLLIAAVVLAEQIEALPDASQHAQRQAIDLEQLHRLQVVLVPLDDGAVRHRRVLHRHHRVQRRIADHEAADMLRQVAREFDQPLHQ